MPLTNNLEIYEPSDDSYLLSETLIKIIPKLLNQNKNLKFLEIGSGRGIQLQTALNSGIKKENIFASDINPGAARHCKKIGFNCIYSDLFDKIKGKYDLIIFNPPYLPKDIKEPAPSRLSTTGGKKGGEIINKFLRQAKKRLNENGKLIILISSLTKRVDFLDYNKKILAEEKLFFEKLKVLELSLNNQN